MRYYRFSDGINQCFCQWEKNWTKNRILIKVIESLTKNWRSLFRQIQFNHKRLKRMLWICFHRLVGHSNNTWHFFDTFLTPLMWHCYVSKYWFLKYLNCIVTWIGKKCLLTPYVGLIKTYYFQKHQNPTFKKFM